MKEIDINFSELHAKGFTSCPGVLTVEECVTLQQLYNNDSLYRSTIDMQRYRFGIGEYRYFNYPLPQLIHELRQKFYQQLAGTANEWMKQLNIDINYPSRHDEFIRQCHNKGQTRPTPLILKYESGGYNTLHQDLYGEVYFPFQVVFILTQHGKDHHGGELVFLEQIPRAQSKAEVVVPNQGDAVVFTTNFRPIKGTKGFYRSKMKHGVSPVKSGTRYAMGIIFHDAA
jgi:uncharacterized protein